MGSVRSGRDIDTALRKKGFTCKFDGKHLRYTFFTGQKRAGVCTLLSHGAMGDMLCANLISRMSRQGRMPTAGRHRRR